jgi:hypothetical protein
MAAHLAMASSTARAPTQVTWPPLRSPTAPNLSDSRSQLARERRGERPPNPSRPGPARRRTGGLPGHRPRVPTSDFKGAAAVP